MKLIDLTNKLASQIIAFEDEHIDPMRWGLSLGDRTGDITTMIYDAVKEFVDENFGAKDEQ